MLRELTILLALSMGLPACSPDAEAPAGDARPNVDGGGADQDDTEPASAAPAARPAAAPRLEASGEVTPIPPGTVPRARGAGAISGQPAPKLSLTDIESGQPWSLADNLDPSGQSCPDAFLVAVMASWCGYCSQSLPTLKALEDQFPDLGIVTVTVDDQPEKQKEELAKVRAAGLTGPVLAADAATANAWIGAGAVPRYVFVNHDGKVVGQDRGFGDKVAPLMPDQARRALGQ